MTTFAAQVRPDVVVRLGGLPASKVLRSGFASGECARLALTAPVSLPTPIDSSANSSGALPDPAVRTQGRRRVRHASGATRSNLVARWLDDGRRDAVSSSTRSLVARAVVKATTETRRRRSSLVRRCPCATSSGGRRRGSPRRTPIVASTGSTASCRRRWAWPRARRRSDSIGDLTMLHDVSGLVDGLGDVRRDVRARRRRQSRRRHLLVSCPRHTSLDVDRFELLFGTPRHHDLDVVAEPFGHAALTRGDAGELRAALDDGAGERQGSA